MLSERIKNIIVDSDKSIIQTMKLMDDSQTKSFLVFKDGKFIGLITNGDLQRAIIANKPFSLPISELVDNEKKIYAHQGDDIQNIKKWMIEVRAEYMPILDKNENLVDLIFWDDVFSDATIWP